MKNNKGIKKTVLLSALAAIAFGTVAVTTSYALFTDTSETNVTVSAGKVDVDVTVGEIVKSYDETSDKLTGVNQSLVVDATKDGVITITNMLPGDIITIPFTLTNNSTVAIKYRATLNGSAGTELAYEFSGVKDTWEYVEKETQLPTGTLILSLPVDATSGIESTTLTFKVEAVQGNAVTEKEVKTNSELVNALSSDIIEKVTLSEDVVIDSGLVSNGNKTLNLNGHTISNTTDIWNDKTFALLEVDSGTLTINGENGGLKAKKDDCFAVFCFGGDVIINGGEYLGNISCVYTQYGTATINAGTFDIQQLNSNNIQEPYGLLLNCLDDNYKNNEANIVVKGGKYKNFDPSNNKAEGENTCFTASGYKSTATAESDDVTWHTVTEDK